MLRAKIVARHDVTCIELMSYRYIMNVNIGLVARRPV